MTPARPGRGEDGVTLVEVLTVLAVSGVVLAFVTGTIVHALRTERRQRAQVAALNDARLAFERVTRDIRGADPLREAALDRIRLDLRQADGTLRSLRYERAGDRLVATDGATGSTRTLVGDLVVGQPLFQYHVSDGSTTTGAQPVNPSSVQSVSVRLKVEPDGAGPVVDLETRVLIRNAAL